LEWWEAKGSRAAWLRRWRSTSLSLYSLPWPSSAFPTSREVSTGRRRRRGGKKRRKRRRRKKRRSSPFLSDPS
jgi:hypothetical protein